MVCYVFVFKPPEFVNRLDGIKMFISLSLDRLTTIVRLHMFLKRTLLWQSQIRTSFWRRPLDHSLTRLQFQSLQKYFFKRRWTRNQPSTLMHQHNLGQLNYKIEKNGGPLKTNYNVINGILNIFTLTWLEVMI